MRPPVPPACADLGRALLRAATQVIVSRNVAPTHAGVPTPDSLSEAAKGMISVELAALVSELLDAHSDTVELAGDLVSDARWSAHLEHMRALQRSGREAIAHSGLGVIA